MALSDRDVLALAAFSDFSNLSDPKEIRYQFGEKFFDGSTFSHADLIRIQVVRRFVRELNLTDFYQLAFRGPLKLP
jgi:hypothetical protein